jgi:hypothetical protein
MMEEMVPEMKELDRETQEQEYFDLWSENIWELVHDKQDQVYNDIMESLKE